MTQECLVMGLCQVVEKLLNAHLWSPWIILILSKICLRLGEVVLFYNIFRALSSRNWLTYKSVKEIRINMHSCLSTPKLVCAALNKTGDLPLHFPSPFTVWHIILYFLDYTGTTVSVPVWKTRPKGWISEKQYEQSMWMSVMCAAVGFFPFS